MGSCESVDRIVIEPGSCESLNPVPTKRQLFLRVSVRECSRYQPSVRTMTERAKTLISFDIRSLACDDYASEIKLKASALPIALQIFIPYNPPRTRYCTRRSACENAF